METPAFLAMLNDVAFKGEVMLVAMEVNVMWKERKADLCAVDFLK
jgi:hypothetical protein